MPFGRACTGICARSGRSMADGRHRREAMPAVERSLCGREPRGLGDQITPKAIIASATLRKPATFAPTT